MNARLRGSQSALHVASAVCGGQDACKATAAILARLVKSYGCDDNALWSLPTDTPSTRAALR